ncbi:MAG: hypothetical protein KC910_10175 [Candidatus Eremiobacteraeota bacterium]|nr:hypothetical protein [Candidatus Eremiobacteraeota bacterium]
MSSTVHIQTELFEFWDGTWTGRVTEFANGLAKVEISGETFEVRMEQAFPNQTASGVWLRSASKPRFPVVDPEPPGRNLTTWLVAVLAERGISVGEAETEADYWGFRAYQGREDALVTVHALGPAEWEIHLHHQPGCNPFAWLVSSELELFEKLWRGLLESVTLTEGIRVVPRPGQEIPPPGQDG